MALNRLLDRTILVVEDEALIALELEELLADAGYSVIGPATSVAQAKELTKDCVPDAALLDMNLHGEMSFEVADQLSKADIPIVFVSGHDLHVLPEAHRDRPVIGKPYDRGLLLRTLADAIK